MIISTIDASYSGSEGIREAFDKSAEILSNFRMVEEKQIIEKLFKKINSNSGLGIYGLDDIINHLKNNIVETIIITDNTELYKVESKCTRCNNIQEKIVEQQKVIPTKTEFQNSPCPSCNAANIETNGQDIVDYLALLAAKTGTKIEVISGNTEHGLMLGSIGKIGAILRYNPNYSS